MKSKGFSLIELMVVIAIIAILAGIALPLYTGHVARSKSSEGGAALSLVKTRQEAFRSTHFRYAATLSELPGYDADTVNVGQFYQITLVATPTTFTATASDTQKAIGSKAPGTDIWTIDQDSSKPEHTSEGY